MNNNMLRELNMKRLLRELLYRDYTIVKPRGALVEVLINPEVTKYNHKERVKISKRSRRHAYDYVSEKPEVVYT